MVGPHRGCEPVVSGVSVICAQVQHQVVISIVLHCPLDLPSIIRCAKRGSILAFEQVINFRAVTLHRHSVSIRQVWLHHYVI